MAENWRVEIEKNKSVITFYSDTSLETMPKSDEHQYYNKDVATPRLPALLINQGFI